MWRGVKIRTNSQRLKAHLRSPEGLYLRQVHQRLLNLERETYANFTEFNQFVKNQGRIALREELSTVKEDKWTAFESFAIQELEKEENEANNQ